MAERLERVVVERNADGKTWNVLRERESSGERFNGCDDLHSAFDAVLAAYYPDGSPRGLVTSSNPTEGSNGQ